MEDRGAWCTAVHGVTESDMNLESEQQTKLILLILNDEEAKLKRLSNLFKVTVCNRVGGVGQDSILYNLILEPYLLTSVQWFLLE